MIEEPGIEVVQRNQRRAAIRLNLKCIDPPKNSHEVHKKRSSSVRVCMLKVRMAGSWLRHIGLRSRRGRFGVERGARTARQDLLRLYLAHIWRVSKALGSDFAQSAVGDEANHPGELVVTSCRLRPPLWLCDRPSQLQQYAK